MLIQCTTKGCMKPNLALLNRQTKEVICQECGNPIANVSEYARRTLSSLGRILRTTERKPFQVHCPACKGRRDVLLIEGGKGALCSACKGELRVSDAVLHAIRLHREQQAKEGGE